MATIFGAASDDPVPPVAGTAAADVLHDGDSTSEAGNGEDLIYGAAVATGTGNDTVCIGPLDGRNRIADRNEGDLIGVRAHDIPSVAGRMTIDSLGGGRVHGSSTIGLNVNVALHPGETRDAGDVRLT